jgi:hypothetical protein
MVDALHRRPLEAAMTWQLGEAIVEDWRDYIERNAAQKLSALEAEYADNVQLPTFAKVYRGQARALGSIEEYPVALVMLDGVDMTEFTSTERAVGQRVIEGNYTVRTGLIVRNPDPEVLELLVYRYVRCIVELLSENDEVPWGTAYDDAGTIRVQIGAGWAPKSGSGPILDAAIIHTLQQRELR